MILGFVLLVFFLYDIFNEVESKKSIVSLIEFKDKLIIVIRDNFSKSFDNEE
jgi:hypothetical protein